MAKKPYPFSVCEQCCTADSGGGIVAETDPTVPEWAKQPNKPSYTADEVGAYSKEESDEAVNVLMNSMSTALNDYYNVQQIDDMFADVKTVVVNVKVYTDAIVADRNCSEIFSAFAQEKPVFAYVEYFSYSKDDIVVSTGAKDIKVLMLTNAQLEATRPVTFSSTARIDTDTYQITTLWNEGELVDWSGNVTDNGWRIETNTLASVEHVDSTIMNNFLGSEQISNKVTEINVDADDTHYPSAKAVYDYGVTLASDGLGYTDAHIKGVRDRVDTLETQIGDIETALDSIIAKYGIGGEAV